MLKDNFIWLSLVFVAGLVIGFLSTQYSYFEFEKGINLIDLVSVIVSIILAFYISRVLEKRKSDSRIEKDFFIDLVKRVIQLTESLSINDENLPFSSTVVKFKEMGMQLYTINQLLNYKGLNTLQKNYSSSQKRMFEFKQKLTSSSVHKEYIVLTTEERISTMTSQRVLKEELYKFIIKLNAM